MYYPFFLNLASKISENSWWYKALGHERRFWKEDRVIKWSENSCCRPNHYSWLCTTNALQLFCILKMSKRKIQPVLCISKD
jgi:hypothetical protein